MTAAALLAVAVGCGGGDDEDRPDPQSLKPAAITEQKDLEEPAPKRSSFLVKEIYRQFQPPEPDPAVKGSAKAIEEGEETCEGKTPAEIREAFIAESDLTEDQEKAVSELEEFEENPSPSFPAGQVAALVYQRSLDGDILPNFNYQGCVYALSLGLKEELAPKGSAQKKGAK